MDNCPDDPYSVTDPAYIYKDLIDGTEWLIKTIRW
jgi:hypothetical protein